MINTTLIYGIVALLGLIASLISSIIRKRFMEDMKKKFHLREAGKAYEGNYRGKPFTLKKKEDKLEFTIKSDNDIFDRITSHRGLETAEKDKLNKISDLRNRFKNSKADFEFDARSSSMVTPSKNIQDITRDLELMVEASERL